MRTVELNKDETVLRVGDFVILVSDEGKALMVRYFAEVSNIEAWNIGGTTKTQGCVSYLRNSRGVHINKQTEE